LNFQSNGEKVGRGAECGFPTPLGTKVVLGRKDREANVRAKTATWGLGKNDGGKKWEEGAKGEGRKEGSAETNMRKELPPKVNGKA